MSRFLLPSSDLVNILTQDSSCARNTPIRDSDFREIFYRTSIAFH